LSQLIRQRLCTLAGLQQRLDELGQPLVGLSEDHRRALTGKDGGPQQFAAECVADHLAHRAGAGIQLGDHVELSVGALPLTEDAQQLRHEDAQLRLRRTGLDGGGQRRQCALRVAGADSGFGRCERFGHVKFLVSVL
jgi:hypothetical protein